MGISNKVSNIVDKGIAVSKKVVGQAGDAVQKFSDKSMVRLEKRQFESKRESQIKELGRIAAAVFITDGKKELRANDSTVAAILEEICACDKEISRREDMLKSEPEKQAKKSPAETAKKKTSAEKKTTTSRGKKASTSKAKTKTAKEKKDEE